MNREGSREEILIAANLLKEELGVYFTGKVNSSLNYITNIPNRLKNSYDEFKLNVVISRYDKVIESLMKKREDFEIRLDTLKRKSDFKDAVRKQKREEFINDITEFVDERKTEINRTFDDTREFTYSKISKASNFMGNVSNSVINTVKNNTTIDITIKEAIDNLKFKRERYLYDKALRDRESARNNGGVLTFRASMKNSFIGQVATKSVNLFKNKLKTHQDNVIEKRNEYERKRMLEEVQREMLRNATEQINNNIFDNGDSVALSSMKR